jgi:hypothetical protein
VARTIIDELPLTARERPLRGGSQPVEPGAWQERAGRARQGPFQYSEELQEKVAKVDASPGVTEGQDRSEA